MTTDKLTITPQPDGRKTISCAAEDADTAFDYVKAHNLVILTMVYVNHVLTITVKEKGACPTNTTPGK